MRGPGRRRHRRGHHGPGRSRSTPRTSRGCATVVNTYGRGPANAIRFGIDAAQRAGRRGDHGRRLRRPAADRRPGPAGRARRRGRRGVALHARRPAGRRAAVQAAAVPQRRAVAAPASPASAPATPPTPSRPTTTEFVREVGIDSRERLRDRPGADRQGAPAAAAGGRDPDDLAGPARSASRTSRWRSGSRKYLRWYRFAFGPRLTLEQLQRQRAADRRPQQRRPRNGDDHDVTR